jgi:hypothetical protein
LTGCDTPRSLPNFHRSLIRKVHHKRLVALAIGAVGAASAAAYFWSELAAEREERMRLEARIAELEYARTSPAATLPEAHPAEATTAKPQSQNPFAPRPSARAGIAGEPTEEKDPEDTRRMLQAAREQPLRMLQDPEYRDAVRAQHRLNMQRAYADLALFTNLSDAETEQLFDLLAEQAMRSMEQRPRFGRMRPPNEDDVREMQRVFEEQRKHNEAEIAALLGPKYNEWQQYQQDGWARAQVSNLRQALALSDEPLRTEQVKQLVDVIAREQQQLAPRAQGLNMGATGRPTAEMMARWTEERIQQTKQAHERIRLAASSLLSPSQYEQLRRQQEQEIKLQELHARQQRARAEAQARGEIPPDPPMANALISVGAP